MTLDEALRCARAYCESSSGFVTVLEEFAFHVMSQNEAVVTYSGPEPPYWVIPLKVGRTSKVGSTTAAIVTPDGAVRVVQYGE